MKSNKLPLQICTRKWWLWWISHDHKANNPPRSHPNSSKNAVSIHTSIICIYIILQYIPVISNTVYICRYIYIHISYIYTISATLEIHETRTWFSRDFLPKGHRTQMRPDNQRKTHHGFVGRLEVSDSNIDGVLVCSNQCAHAIYRFLLWFVCFGWSSCWFFS